METGELSGTLAVGSSATALDFYRPHRRVVLFLFFAPVFYEVWWYWRLFSFTRGEGLPRARRFWWLLVPIYGWVVLYRQFDDLKQADISVGVPALNSGLAIWLVIFSWVAGDLSDRINNSYDSFVAFVVSGVLIVVVGFLVQAKANAYLKSRHPQTQPIGMTWGEITATVLGISLFAVVILGTFSGF